MYVREFAYVPACEHICHSMRAYACTCVFMSAFVDVCANQMCACGCAHTLACACVRVHGHIMC